MDPEIKRSVRQLFVKFLLFQAVIFVAAVALSLVFTGYFKARLGRQLAAASRDSLLAGDARHVITTMPSSMSRDFTGMVWRPAGQEKGFSVPAGAENSSGMFYTYSRMGVCFDEDRKVPAGELFFYYPRWTPVSWGVLSWLVIALLSLPVALRERRRLIRDYTLLLDLRIKESYSALAAQVAHDIRSPLAALDSALADFSSVPEDRRELARGALGRIGEIARDLLENYRVPGAPAPAAKAVAAHDLKALVAPVIAEKRAQYSSRAGLAIEFSGEDGVRARVHPAELRRMVSNLVNNAVEALDGPGRVSVSLSRGGSVVTLKISDDGKGIPPEILSKLGQKGATHGKAGGTGLGLYHARSCAESWGGSLNITSRPGAGTEVAIELPEAVPQAAPKNAVLIDDDALVRINWKTAARVHGVELLVFSAPADFLAAAGGVPKDTPVYIDSNLGNGIRGEEIAVQLKELGFTDICLETGHAPEKFSAINWLKVAGKEPPWA
ncbi:MAG: hypothetical protein A2X31_00490 [Elusimicrobia bacterium GWB2_63_22]|nr:MAG: hypothetical protein A2X31_00490 [Elusimicrobia bacterium GWB2_63_22]